MQEILEKLKRIELKSNLTPFNMLYIAYQDAYRKEVLHSKLLAGLLNPNENHKLGDTPLKHFLNKINLAANSLQDVKVETEKNVKSRHIDIFISWKENDNESKKHAVIIENKLHNASDQKEQLNAYYNGTKEKYSIEKIVYLPFNKSDRSFKDTDTRDELHEKCIDFDATNIVEWLDDMIRENIETAILKQYQEFFECLINTKFTYMKSLEIINCSSIEEINKLENLANIVKSEEWCKARFALLSEKLKAKFGEKLEIQCKRYTDNRCYAEFFFPFYEKWIELWLEEKDIALWIVSKDKRDSIEIVDKEYKYWGSCHNYHYYKTDLHFDYPVNNQELIDTIVPMLEELARYDTQRAGMMHGIC